MTKTKPKLEKKNKMCDCGRVAVVIKSKDGVCARCLEWERHYYGKSRRPVHGARSATRRVLEPYMCYLAGAAMS